MIEFEGRDRSHADDIRADNRQISLDSRQDSSVVSRATKRSIRTLSFYCQSARLSSDACARARATFDVITRNVTISLHSRISRKPLDPLSAPFNTNHAESDVTNATCERAP